MNTMTIKSSKEIALMKEGGKKLNEIKNKLSNEILPGVSALEIENLATKLIKKAGGTPSFKMVSGYDWSTCVNVNEGIVHGVPKKQCIFKNGDVVSVDVGLFFNGFHTDTSITVGLNPSDEIKNFLTVGKKALKESINEAVVGNYIFDVSKRIQNIIADANYQVIMALVGHGIGKSLHEEPQIPCFVQGKRESTPLIKVGLVMAIEVMYTLGKPEVKLEDDKWTIATRDGKISALYEDTVAVTAKGPIVIT